MKRQLVLVAAVLAAGWGLMLMSLAPQHPPSSSDPTPVITRDEFNRIETGMTYQECVSIIGATGTPYGSSSEPGDAGADLEWITYRWGNNDSSYAHVSFHFGRVGRKHEVNLK